jgi:GT2 family glycosyltransferase
MALFVRTKLFAQLGMIDEGFFAYAEDNDFEWRARQAGYQVLCTNVPIWHRSQATFGRTPLRAAALQIRNNLRLALKHESIFGVWYQFVRHWAKACIPFLQIDRSDPIATRLHPSNIFVNFCIWLYAVLWNFTHLAETLRRRRTDALCIVRTRRQLGLN